MTISTPILSNDSETDEDFDFAHANLGYRLFCEALNDNRLKAGMTLTQNELSSLLGISLSPLRETLVLLEDYGLVEIRQRAGIRIFYPEVSFIRENMQYRSMIEVFAITVFVRNVKKGWLDTMKTQHIALQTEWRAKRDDRDDALEQRSRQLDRRFHADIVAALGNAAIESHHRRICQNIHLARKVHQTSFGKAHYLDTIEEHLHLLSAVEASDLARAGEALEEHFRFATHRLFIAP